MLLVKTASEDSAPLYGGQSRESHLPIYHLVEVNETNKKKNPENGKRIEICSNSRLSRFRILPTLFKFEQD